MHRYRGGWASTGPSKASSSTVCQKFSNTERPYISRPSRTKQLFDPNVRPQLTMAAPPEEAKQDLTRKEGIADEILAKKESERSRGAKRRRESPSISPPRRSRRSPSVSSVSSYSSISSGRSPSPPPRHSGSRSQKARSPSPDRRVRRRYKESPSPEHGRGRRLSTSEKKGEHAVALERKERSLSPFSRRLAMTKAMGRGYGS
ncbi:hypothetical protein BDZ91DRAFT_770192 [Kalaharituber pfeilii]|nr:hypothetical protein BDZ91DRAFT_770192 [Kalaharituber pfeilii]